MTEQRGLPDGEPMVEIYDVLTDEMVLAPKALADRAELLKNAWAAGAETDAHGWPKPHTGDPVLFGKAIEAARELHASFITRPGDPLPKPKRRGMLKPESLAEHDKRHERARKRGPKET